MSILRDEEFYYQYEQNGGTIEIPKEVFWELYYDSKEEIERLNNIINNIDKKCKYLLENEKVIINGKTYYKQKCDDIITNFIYEELKGSDKE